MKCWKAGLDFKNEISRDERVSKILSHEIIESCFDEKKALKHVDFIFNRVGL